MNNSYESATVELVNITAAIESAKSKIAPLWDTRDYVAVNPLFGYRGETFFEAVKQIHALTGTLLLPERSFFKGKFQSGDISESDIEHALTVLEKNQYPRIVETINRDELISYINSRDLPRTANVKVKCISDLYDDENKSDTTETITQEISKWLSAYYDEGQAIWRIPEGNLRLFSTWRRLIQYDTQSRSRVFSGRLRVLSESLAEDPHSAIEQMSYLLMRRLSLSQDRLSFYFSRLLFTVQGWSSLLQRIESGRGEIQETDLRPGTGVVDILAIRMAYDLSLLMDEMDLTALAIWDNHCGELDREAIYRFVWLNIYETAIKRNIARKLTVSQNRSGTLARPLAQFAFCIDVRSEVIRRHLETNSEHVETIGFAGFFGLPIAVKKLGYAGADPLCPVLIKPALTVEETSIEPNETSEKRKRSAIQRANSKRVRSSANSSFSLAETFGISYALKLLTCSEAIDRPDMDFESQDKTVYLDHASMDLETKVNLGFNSLLNMGFSDRFAKYVFLFGHGGESANNPYKGALDCGACAGHNGKYNAELLANILNEPEVRTQIAEKGIVIPLETRFIPGWHNTTKDLLIVDSLADRIGWHDDYKNIRSLINQAQYHAQNEKAGLLTETEDVVPASLEERLHLRASDWSELQPEWALARNHSFIVGRRKLTYKVNLDGRSFLHDYDESNDVDLKKLELIMTAPMIVTNWINAQYYASTIDPDRFGTGNKTINNVVGTIGCIQGNGSDLLGGLSEQSVRRNGQYFHEPVRLQVFIEAKTGSIDWVISKHSIVSDLINNDWLHIISVSPDNGQMKAKCREGWIDFQQAVH